MNLLNDVSILILAHSRADKFSNCIKKVYNSGIRKIYLSLDGPRNSRDVFQQEFIENEFYKYSNNCELFLNKLDKNYGCRDALIFALDWFFSQEEYGIIIEDDLFLSDNCLLTFSKLLKKYQKSKNIMSLSSYNEFVEENPTRLIKSPVWRGWGWATWSDKWLIHKEFISKTRKLSMNKLIKLLPENLRNPKNVAIVKSVHLNYLKAYDYEFNFTHLALGYSSLTLSGINMNNVGFDKDATFCFDKNRFPFLKKFKDQEVNINIIDKMDYLQTKSTLNEVGFIPKSKITFLGNLFQRLNIFKYSFIFFLRRIKRVFINKSGFNIFE